MYVYVKYRNPDLDYRWTAHTTCAFQKLKRASLYERVIAFYCGSLLIFSL